MAEQRRRRLEALLVSGQASLQRARARSLVVDTMAWRVRPPGTGAAPGCPLAWSPG